MVIFTECLIAAILTIGLLSGTKNSCKRGYIIPSRINLHIEVPVVFFKELSGMQPGNISERVLQACQMQEERFRDHEGIYSRLA